MKHECKAYYMANWPRGKFVDSVVLYANDADMPLLHDIASQCSGAVAFEQAMVAFHRQRNWPLDMIRVTAGSK